MLKDGAILKRRDWNYVEHAYRKLEIWNDQLVVSITGEYNFDPDSKTMYGFTFADIESQMWVPA